MRTALLPLLLAAPLCAASPVFTVIIDDPGGELEPHTEAIRANLQAAADKWASLLGSNASIDILLHTDGGVPYAYGRSFTTSYVTTTGGFDIFEQGAAGEIRTGVDPNGPDIDIEIGINPDYAVNELWYDPEPTVRTEPVPGNRTDAMSVFLHELAHALVYNGWIDGFNGGFPGDYMSTFDQQTAFDGKNFFFIGSHASLVYGTAPPITYGNPFHLGNQSPRPGKDLILQLMNGIVFFHGQRYFISNLDLAIAADVGLRTRPLCPGDADLSGGVNFTDLNIVLSNFGASEPGGVLDGDLDADGDVDFSDLNIVLSNFGSDCLGTD